MAIKNAVDMVEGYSEMSTEDKLKALEALTFDDRSDEIEKLKNAVSKANGESAEWKRKHNALLTDEEKKTQADKEQLEQILAENKALKREKTISDFTASLIQQGYGKELAVSSATAMADGDNETLLKNQTIFAEEYKKKIIADAMGGTPYPVGGTQPTTDYGKEITEAQRRGDLTSAVTLMRLQQEASRRNTP